MRSAKCLECGFVGWSDVEYCKACGAPFGQRPTMPVQGNAASASWSQPEGQKKGLAIFSLVLGIISFFTFGLLGLGAILGIILAVVAMGKVKREPWNYGGRGIAIAGLVLSITSLVSVVPVGIIAAIAIPNLLASRMAANEGSAIHSLRTISSAEMTYQATYQKYATLEELAAAGLIDPKLASGVKSGYRFSVEVSSDDPESAGFAAYCVPVDYRNSGKRSFYVDQTSVIRGADNHGGPSSTSDAPLEAGPMRQARDAEIEFTRRN